MSALLSIISAPATMRAPTLTGHIALNGDQIRVSMSKPTAPFIGSSKMANASKPVRDRKYLDFLRSEGVCDACGYPVHLGTIDPAHGPVNGMGSKGSDLEAIPLCRSHHNEMEKLRWPAFCAKYKLDRKGLVCYWNEAYSIVKSSL